MTHQYCDVCKEEQDVQGEFERRSPELPRNEEGLPLERKTSLGRIAIDLGWGNNEIADFYEEHMEICDPEGLAALRAEMDLKYGTSWRSPGMQETLL